MTGVECLCNAKGSAAFRERDVGGAWITRKIEPGSMFVTHSKTPYEVRWTSPAGQEVEVIQIHLAVDVFRAALEETYPGKADTVEVIDFFGRDEVFSHLCQACADILTARTRGNTRRVADLTRLFASYLVEQYTDAARERAEVRGGLPILFGVGQRFVLHFQSRNSAKSAAPSGYPPSCSQQRENRPLVFRACSESNLPAVAECRLSRWRQRFVQ